MRRPYQQVWDPNAEFVFIREMPKLLERDRHVGDAVTPAIRRHMGVNGLLAWWKAGCIAIAGAEGSPAVLPEPELIAAEPVEVLVVPPSGDATPPVKRKRGRPRKNPLPDDANV